MARIFNVLLANASDSLLAKQQCYHCLSFQRGQALCNREANNEMYIIKCWVHPWALALQTVIKLKTFKEIKNITGLGNTNFLKNGYTLPVDLLLQEVKFKIIKFFQQCNYVMCLILYPVFASLIFSDSLLSDIPYFCIEL